MTNSIEIKPAQGSVQRWFSIVKSIASIVAVIVALITLGKGLAEYSKQGAQQRAEHFLEMRHRFKDNENFHRICALLWNDDDGLLKLTLQEKTDFIGFFEEIVLLTNSGLLRFDVAHYMFGFYAVHCWKSEKFWNNMNRENPYWSLFRDLVERTEHMKKDFVYDRQKLRL